MGRGQDRLTPKGALSPISPGVASSWRMCALGSPVSLLHLLVCCQPLLSITQVAPSPFWPALPQ